MFWSAQITSRMLLLTIDHGWPRRTHLLQNEGRLDQQKRGYMCGHRQLLTGCLSVYQMTHSRGCTLKHFRGGIGGADVCDKAADVAHRVGGQPQALTSTVVRALHLLRKSFGGVAVLLGEYLLNAVFTICVQAELTTHRVLSAAGWKR